MTVYALRARGLHGHCHGAVAHIQLMRQGTGGGLQPSVSSAPEGQNRRYSTGAGADCNGKQHLSDHGIAMGSQIMHGDAGQKERRPCSMDEAAHSGRQMLSCEKTCTVRHREHKTAAGWKGPQSESLRGRSQKESVSESESESRSGSESTDDTSSVDVSQKSKQRPACHPQHTAFERLDDIFSNPTSGTSFLKSRVGQASPAYRNFYQVVKTPAPGAAAMSGDIHQTLSAQIVVCLRASYGTPCS